MSGPHLSELLSGAGFSTAALGSDPRISRVIADSRVVEEGDLFVAIAGAVQDGASFAAQAAERGARAVVAQVSRPTGLRQSVEWVEVGDSREAAALLAREWFGRPDEALELIGVTGTNGKTSVAYSIESIADAAGRSCGRVGTLGWSFAGESAKLERTTPEATELYELLGKMRESGVELVALEVSSHALRLHRTAGARFSVGAFLNLGSDHLDFHGSTADYKAAKMRLIRSLDAQATAVAPEDSPLKDEIENATSARTFTFGRGPGSTVRLRDETSDLEGSRALLETPDGDVSISSPLLGGFVLENAAAAACCTLALGFDLEAIARGLSRLRRVPGRMEQVDCGQPFTVLVDYAHTEDALRALLEWLRGVAHGDVSVVFGCGGERDRGKRAEMGRTAARLADRVYVTSDNPRGEDPQRIVDEIRAGARTVAGGEGRVRTLVDRRKAIAEAVSEARRDDVVVVAGKGHESTQTIGSEALPFNDRQVLIELLGADHGCA